MFAGLLLRWIVLPVALLAAGFAAGWRVHTWRDASGLLRGEQHVIAVTKGQGDANTAVAVAQQAQQDHVRVVTRTLIERVPTYVTAQADADCTVPRGFVELHDAAANGVELPGAPDAASEPVGGPSGVALSAVGLTVAENYGSYHQVADELTGWQTWYAAQRAAFGTK